MANLTDPRDIIIAPVVSEKSYGLRQPRSKQDSNQDRHRADF